MTAAEREGAIQDLKGTGLLNRDIARRIGKPESWVSSILTADTERKHLDEMGIDTTPLSSHAVAQIARVPEEKESKPRKKQSSEAERHEPPNRYAANQTTPPTITHQRLIA